MTGECRPHTVVQSHRGVGEPTSHERRLHSAQVNPHYCARAASL